MRLKRLVAACFIVSVSCLALFAKAQEAPPAVAEEAKTEPAADPTGTWTWTREFNGNSMEMVLKLNWDGKELSGEYTSFRQPSKIKDAKFDDKGFSFVVEREFNGNSFAVDFEGKASKDAIDGTVSMDWGGDTREFEWHAKRKVEESDVLGKWQLRLDTPNGLLEPTLTVTKSKAGLEGKYESPFGVREVKELKLKDNKLEWIVEGETDQFTIHAEYSGHPRGNTIEGTNNYDINGNTGEMEFTGKRTPPKPAEEKTPEATPATNDSASPEENG